MRSVGPPVSGVLVLKILLLTKAEESWQRNNIRHLSHLDIFLLVGSFLFSFFAFNIEECILNSVAYIIMPMSFLFSMHLAPITSFLSDVKYAESQLGDST